MDCGGWYDYRDLLLELVTRQMPLEPTLFLSRSVLEFDLRLLMWVLLRLLTHCSSSGSGLK